MKPNLIRRAMNPLAHLFWKTQIGILRACPPLSGLVSKVSLGAGAINSGRVWIKTLFRFLLQTPRALLQHWRNLRENRMVLARVTIPITTRCNLCCDKCVGHLPDCKKRGDTPIAQLIEDMRTLASCVDYVYYVSISGGEPFLHPNLDEVVRFCAASDKFGDISVLTNGTVLPSEKTLAALKAAHALVKISRFPQALAQAEHLKQILQTKGIRYMHENGEHWNDLGDFGQLQPGNAMRRFNVCFQQLCFFLYNGRLYLCMQTALLMDEGYLVDCEGDYFDMRAIDCTSFRAQVKKLLKRQVVSACSYCLGFTYQTPKIPVAVQREPQDHGEEAG